LRIDLLFWDAEEDGGPNCRFSPLRMGLVCLFNVLLSHSHNPCREKEDGPSVQAFLRNQEKAEVRSESREGEKERTKEEGRRKKEKGKRKKEWRRKKTKKENPKKGLVRSRLTGRPSTSWLLSPTRRPFSILRVWANRTATHRLFSVSAQRI